MCLFFLLPIVEYLIAPSQFGCGTSEAIKLDLRKSLFLNLESPTLAQSRYGGHRSRARSAVVVRAMRGGVLVPAVNLNIKDRRC